MIKELLGLKQKPRKPKFMNLDESGRIFPGSFAPVITFENGKRVIKPMRYRVRPNGSGTEIPSKYNVFNARKDSLEKRKTWQSLFMKNHGLFPFLKFYEWVEDKHGKKVLINFNPEQYEIMWAPVVFDHWVSKNGEIDFHSFALITDDPPPEIEAQGHDRCPIFIKESLINDWLQPNKLTIEEAYKILGSIEEVYFQHMLAS